MPSLVLTEYFLELDCISSPLSVYQLCVLNNFIWFAVGTRKIGLFYLLALPFLLIWHFHKPSCQGSCLVGLMSLTHWNGTLGGGEFCGWGGMYNILLITSPLRISHCCDIHTLSPVYRFPAHFLCDCRFPKLFP